MSRKYTPGAREDVDGDLAEIEAIVEAHRVKAHRKSKDAEDARRASELERALNVGERAATAAEELIKREHEREALLARLVATLEETAQWFHHQHHIFAETSPESFYGCSIMPCAGNRAALAAAREVMR